MEDQRLFDTSEPASPDKKSMLIDLGGYICTPWSFSRMETAGACLYKFHKVYIEGTKEVSDSLTLGSLSHEIIANLIKDGEPSLSKAELFLAQAYPIYEKKDPTWSIKEEVVELLPYMVEFAIKWSKFLSAKHIKDYYVENSYGVDAEFTRTVYEDKDTTYFRGVVDLWAYDKKDKVLYVVDHKTNKSTMSAKKVKEHHQLNVYVAMLSKMFNLKITKAVIGLNFLRKKKVVWATVYPEDTEEFLTKFMNTLTYLENKIYDCNNSLIWPATTSYKCGYCTFKNSCDAYLERKRV